MQPMQFNRDQVKAQLAKLASLGIFIGTSSWKYPGWQRLLYDRDRYVWRGRYAEARFERNCLAEYAEVFSTVSVDAAYYKFPDVGYLSGLAEQVPPGFQFAFKVTDDITLKQFPLLPRFGSRAGKPNENFLNADLFVERFLKPCEAIRGNVGLLMLEFSRFSRGDFTQGREFVAQLDAFLGRLPCGWPIGVEIRNREFLHPDYFATLSKHGATHVFNSWTDMPPVIEQIAMPGSIGGEQIGARFLLKPGRKYEQAVKAFSPYDKIQDAYPEGRAAITGLVRKALECGKKRTYIFVNNRFEGCSLETIAAVLAGLDSR